MKSSGPRAVTDRVNLTYTHLSGFWPQVRSRPNVMGLKSLIKKASYSIAPSLAASADEYRWLRKWVHKLNTDGEKCQSPAEHFALLEASGGYQARQKTSEIVGLLTHLADLKPKRILEIEALNGGTLFLFTRVADSAATILSMDLTYSWAKRKCFPRFARERQQVRCVEIDSHIPAATKLVTEHFQGQLLDFLFIDGDHSYEGVAADFRDYSPFVRPGGSIAFHDIVPDHKTRFGIDTPSYAGGVHRLWAELRSQYPCQEWIDHPDQDGYGIGVLTFTSPQPPHVEPAAKP